MTRKIVTQSEFKRLARNGEARGVAVARPQATVVRVGETTGRVRRWRFSDGSTDRLHDRIDPNGWQTANFLAAGGPVLFAHDSSAPPVGRTVSLFSTGTALLGDIEFADAETYEFADTVFKLIEADFLRGGSVGFLPLSYSFADDPARPGGINFIKQELLEFSIAPVPALPTALVEARSIGDRHAAVIEVGGARPQLGRLRWREPEPN